MLRSVVGLFATLLLLGCNQQRMIEQFSTPAAQAQAKAYVAGLRSGDFDAIEKSLDPSIKTPAVRSTLMRMAALLPAGPPTSVKLVGANTLTTPTSTQANTTLEYQWGAKWFLCNVAVQKTGATQTITGFNVYPLRTSVEDQARFTLTGKGPVQYGILAGAILAFSLTLLALVSCIRTKGIAHKWFWIIFVIIGFGQLSVNWSTGRLGLQLLSVSLFSAGAAAQIYSPWIVSMSVPVGAIVFLLRRHRLASVKGGGHLIPGDS